MRIRSKSEDVACRYSRQNSQHQQRHSADQNIFPIPSTSAFGRQKATRAPSQSALPVENDKATAAPFPPFSSSSVSIRSSSRLHPAFSKLAAQGFSENPPLSFPARRAFLPHRLFTVRGYVICLNKPVTQTRRARCTFPTAAAPRSQLQLRYSSRKKSEKRKKKRYLKLTRGVDAHERRERERKRDARLAGSVHSRSMHFVLKLSSLPLCLPSGAPTPAPRELKNIARRRRCTFLSASFFSHHRRRSSSLQPENMKTEKKLKMKRCTEIREGGGGAKNGTANNSES